MPKKILITDDDKDLVEAMSLRFKKDGYTVIQAYNGEECFERAKTEHPDLVIMDVAMPVMDGYSSVKALKEDDLTKHIPIMILTGKDQMEDIFMMEGVKEYVIKPFEYEVIAQKVKDILENDQ